MNKKKTVLSKETIRLLIIHLSVFIAISVLVGICTYYFPSSNSQITRIFIIVAIIAFGLLILHNIDVKAERKKLDIANKKLKEQEELFRTIFEQSPVGIAIGSDDLQVTEMNQKYKEIMGITQQEVSRINWNDITNPVDLNANLKQSNLLSSEKTEGHSMNKKYLRPDSSAVWVNMTVAPLEVENIPYNHVCIIEDITEQKKIEEDLRESERSMSMLLSNLPGMAYRCKYDRDWTMLFVSEGCFELTGYKPESLIQNREISFNDLISEEYREYLWNKWVQLLKDKNLFREEYYITAATGEKKWVLEQGRGVYNENGEVEAIEGLIIDISIQKHREEQILYLTYHDDLTGLYNRRFFEEEKVRLDRKEYLPLSIITGDINGLKLINDALGHKEGDNLINTIAKIIVDCCDEGEIVARVGGDEFSVLLPNTSDDVVYKKMKRIEKACQDYRIKTKDDPYHVSISLGCSTKNIMEETLNSVLKTAEDYMYRDKLLQNKSLHSSVLSSMKTTLFERSQETEEHAQRLIKLSKEIGMDMNLKDENLNELELLSTLHDIGKIGISDTILKKPGKLNDEEWVEMKKHPSIGYRIAMSTPELSHIAEYILHHHERWDGSGYPEGLKGEEIPLLSRILAVVDAFDAMTEDRSYRKAMSKEAAIEEIKNNIGKQFDPYIAQLFIGKNS